MISRRDRRSKSDLVTSIESLRDEVRVLREVLDEIRDSLQWQNRNAADFPSLLANRPAALSLAEASFPALSRTSDDSANDLPDDVSLPTKQRNFL